jgi:hypothetical protein
LAALLRPFGFIPTKYFVLIIWLSNIMALSVPDEGYSRNVARTKLAIFSLIIFTHQRKKKYKLINKLLCTT